ncbi:dynamin family protein [Rhodanobacter sp. 115]|uniref:dynamin family protein n=1 Tax=Rhodanobacter sp. FW021-MT20 TaxID=1162282 RepID=UPI000260D2FC|nr:dynamin family protein [Rhodanobacter sp. 115]EIL88428.1 hypothetical protein UU5_17107 [Rhodanobacter sp. 115]
MLQSQQTYTRYIDDVVTHLAGANIDSGGFPGIRQNLGASEVIVPVIGGFSAGKSSLLNAMLNRELLPVGITPETELATELRYGEDEHLLAWRFDGTSERMDLGAINKLKAKASEFTHLQAFVANVFLKQRPEIVLVDMPGFGSSFANHDKAAAYYLPRGAHFIVVTSIEDGNLTGSMTRHLSAIHDLGRSFSFVVSKTNLRTASDVDAVVGVIKDQIHTAFDIQAEPHQLGDDGGERMRRIVESLDPDRIMRDAFTPILKDETMNALARINSAEAAFHRSNSQSKRRQEELEWSLDSIKNKRDGVISDIKEARVSRAIDQCMKELTRELDYAQGELVQAATSGNRDAFGGVMGDITRSVVERVMQTELRDAGKAVAAAIADVLKPVDGSDIGTGGGLGQELASTVERSLSSVSNTLSSWTTAVANHNAAEIERMQKDPKDNGDKAKTVSRATYQGLATVLAVTTSLVNPAIELLIIFLPTIIGWFNESRVREEIRQKISNQVIPTYIRDLRTKLPGIVEEQVNALVQEVTLRFEAEIDAQQKSVDESLASSKDASGDVEQKLAALTAAREAIKRIAKEVLYGEVNA